MTEPDALHQTQQQQRHEQEQEQAGLEPTLQQILTLLQTRTDTARFVGLSLLLSLLSARPEVARDGRTARRCWDAVSKRFLGRLLRSRSRKKKEDGKEEKEGEGTELLVLGVAVVRAFAGMLLVPGGVGETEEDEEEEEVKRKKRDRESREDITSSFLPLIAPLLSISSISSPTTPPDTIQQAQGTVILLCSTRLGARHVLLDEAAQSALCEILAGAGPLAFGEMLSRQLVNSLAGSKVEEGEGEMEVMGEKVLGGLLERYLQDEERPKEWKVGEERLWLVAACAELVVRLFLFFSCLCYLLSLVSSLLTEEQSSHSNLSQRNVNNLITLVKKYFTYYPLPTTLKPCIRILQVVIQHPSRPDPFFPSKIKSSQKGAEKNPFSYTFITLVIIEIRSTIPSLLEKLATPDYQEIAQHLAACYDMLGYFIFQLLRLSDDDDDDNEEDILSQVPRTTCDIPPSLLLQLRKDVGETLSLTIEYFRDRWDAAITGIPSFSSADTAKSLLPTASTEPKALTWTNPTMSPEEDPILLAGLRTLGIWLREDDSELLRQEAAGVMDVYKGLYMAREDVEIGEQTTRLEERRKAVRVAMEGVVGIEEGVQAFLAHDMVFLFLDDLITAVDKLDKMDGTRDAEGIKDLVRVLLPVIESPCVPQTKRTWLQLVGTMAKKGQVMERGGSAAAVQEQEQEQEAFTAVGQLAVALLLKAATKDRQARVGECRRLRDVFASVGGEGASEVVDGLAEVMLTIK